MPRARETACRAAPGQDSHHAGRALLLPGVWRRSSLLSQAADLASAGAQAPAHRPTGHHQPVPRKADPAGLQQRYPASRVPALNGTHSPARFLSPATSLSGLVSQQQRLRSQQRLTQRSPVALVACWTCLFCSSPTTVPSWSIQFILFVVFCVGLRHDSATQASLLRPSPWQLFRRSLRPPPRFPRRSMSCPLVAAGR